jgi:hypothetical protein
VVNILDMTMCNPFSDFGGLDVESDSDELDYIEDDVQDHSNKDM